MMLIPIVILGILIYFMYNNFGSSSIGKNRQSPENLLKERFVNGEIDEDTYLKMKEILKG